MMGRGSDLAAIGKYSLARFVFLSAAAYNVSGGIVLIFFLDRLGPLLEFPLPGPTLFRLFAGGTAVLFGIGYIRASRDIASEWLLATLGTALKYWAFAISGLCYARQTIPLSVFVLFGVANLAFAIMMSVALWRR